MLAVSELADKSGRASERQKERVAQTRVSFCFDSYLHWRVVVIRIIVNVAHA